MSALILAIIAGVGAYLAYTSLVLGTRELVVVPSIGISRQRRIDDWFAQAGLAGVRRGRIGGVIAALFGTGVVLGWALFGGVLVPLVAGLFASTLPVASYRQRRRKRRSEATDAWPRMIEEIRLRCGSLGQPVPQALFDVGKAGPAELRGAFVEAEREWLLSTDFTRAVGVLKAQLADPTADTTCETLLVAHSLGGSGVEKRLSALSEDRRADAHGRKDARSKQAGVRFARRFVLLVPVGMALVGMSIGNGRAAYATSTGQLGVTFGLLTLACCWWWAGRLIQLPDEDRVFRG